MPSTLMHNCIPENRVSNLPPNKTQVSIPLEPPTHPLSNKPSIFLEQLKELKA